MLHLSYVLADDPLAAWGQIAAIVLLLYMFVLIVIGLVLAFVLMLGLNWVRQKVELIKKLRPTVDSINTTTEDAVKGLLPPPPSPQYAAHATQEKIVRTVAQVPLYAHNVEQKIEQGSDKVAGAVIEFRARTEMAKGMLKAFFLPGLTHRPQEKTVLEQEGIGFRSPGYRMLVDQKVPDETSAEYGTGYVGGIKASQLKAAPVEVVTETPKELQNVPTAAEHKDVSIH
jgi:hypothetical protein